MRLALLADLHANQEALVACLAHAKQCGAEHYVFLGDLVGYGANPAWVVERVMAYATDGAIVIQGNHDHAVAHHAYSTMQSDAALAVTWTQTQLQPDHLAFLANLPLQHEDIDCLFVHANAWAPGDWAYIHSCNEATHSLKATRCRYTFCGHVHPPSLFHMGSSERAFCHVPTPEVAIPLSQLRRWLCIVGSVGQPRDGNPAACYALFDLSQATLTYHRIPYDHMTAARKVIAAGLPERLAHRLITGT
ncbi:metallophosphoesterase family protein [Chitinivorax sp. B]|uniref:metallophosphoesterase family protein n=1 Tax=Chitinivorax sp. B TaxID=2502235 RepID=UPI0010F5C7D0|nr:metallophosphoesterase family protein [Chitinivorax sp. B]